MIQRLAPRLALALGASASLVLAACGGSDAAQTPPESTAELGALPTSAVLPTIAGAQLDFGDLAGQDTVLWFWAPW